MPTACFYNFSDYSFTGSWNNEHQMFAPKSRTFMPAFLAQHFAKHLTNRELHRAGLDHATSPKIPEDVPEFNKLFRTAYIRDRDLPGTKRNTLKDMIDAVDKNRQPQDETPKVVPPSVLGPDIDTVIAPREVSENEDPNFKRETSTGEPSSEDVGNVRSNAPIIVTPPDMDDNDEDGYEGVPVPPQAPPAPITTS